MTEDEQIKAAIEMSMKDQNMNVNEPITIEDDDDDYYNDFGEEGDYEIIPDDDDDVGIVEVKSESKGKMKEEEKEESFEIDPSLTKDELCEKCKKKKKKKKNLN